MRLLSCDINNFGCLSDRHFSFDEGLNVFIEPNGWGKSTLASFFRVMFYGFEDENKKSLKDRERNKYLPWGRGTFGGSLCFETDGKKYIMNRVFGANAKEDTFELLDFDTKLRSNDFTENIGEELFQIDSDSFKRTVMVSQNDCATGSTDGINAKIGNLTDETDDMGNYEEVMKTLKDRINSLSPGRATGYLNKLKNDITYDETQLKRLDGLLENEKALLSKQKECRDAASLLTDKNSQLKKELDDTAKYEAVYEKKQRYEALLQKLKTKKMLLDERKSVFTNDIPSQEELRVYIKKADLLKEKESMKEAYALDDLSMTKYKLSEKTFENGVPDRNEIDSYFDDFASMSDIKDEIREKKQQIAELRKKEKMQGALALAALLASGAGALYILFFKKAFINYAYILLAASVIMLVVLICILTGKTKKRKLIVDLKEDITINEEQIEKIKTQTTEFLETFKVNCNEENVLNSLKGLKELSIEYSMLNSQYDKYRALETENRELGDEISAYLAKIGAKANADSKEQLLEMVSNRSAYDNSLSEYQEIENEVKTFEESIEVKTLNSISDNPPKHGIDELTVMIKENDEALDELRSEIAQYENRLSDVRKEIDELNETAELLKEKEEDFAAQSEHFEVLKAAREYLEKAKESFTLKYIGPVKNAFTKYIQILNKTENSEKFEFDANTNLLIKDEGMYREISNYSQGLRDLYGLCFRMALTDAMYQNEKPMIIFDDPFTNLDSDRMAGGLEFLNRIAKEYQILYFTCHESRV